MGIENGSAFLLKIGDGAAPPGFATVVILLLMSMTLNAMFLGILGEYIGRIFMQTKNLNAPIVEATLNVEAEVAEATPIRFPVAR